MGNYASDIYSGLKDKLGGDLSVSEKVELIVLSQGELRSMTHTNNPVEGLSLELGAIREAGIAGDLEIVMQQQAIGYWGSKLDNKVRRTVRRGRVGVLVSV